jgi:hypothetical protein
MIKGLGHLIRTMFGGKRPAPALPSHMVGAVEGETVHAPLASDDVLRRAMEAAGETADMPIPQAGRSGQYLHPRAEDVGTLPTLFLHGKVAEPEVLPEVQHVPVVVPELSAEVLLTAPEYAAAPDIVIESERAQEAVASRPPQLETLMSFQEIVQAPRFSELALVMTEWGGHSERIQRPVTAHVLAAAAPAIVQAPQVMQAPPVQPVVLEEAPVVASVTLGPLNAEVFAEETLGSEEVLQADPVEDPYTEEMLPEEAVAEEKLADDAAVTEAAAPKSPSRRKAEPGTTTRRKKSAKALPEDAVWLTDAVIWTQCGSWREFWLPPTDPESSARVEEFRTLAAEGKLTVWGRTGEASEWTAIAASHWKKAGFDPLAFLAGRENAFSQAPVKKSRTKPPADPVRYDSLMVSRAAVEELWAAREEQQAAVA